MLICCLSFVKFLKDLVNFIYWIATWPGVYKGSVNLVDRVLQVPSDELGPGCGKGEKGDSLRRTEEEGETGCGQDLGKILT